MIKSNMLHRSCVIYVGLYAIYVCNWNWKLKQDHFLIKHWSKHTDHCPAPVGLEEYSAHDRRAATLVQRTPVTWQEWGLWVQQLGWWEVDDRINPLADHVATYAKTEIQCIDINDALMFSIHGWAQHNVNVGTLIWIDRLRHALCIQFSTLTYNICIYTWKICYNLHFQKFLCVLHAAPVFEAIHHTSA